MSGALNSEENVRKGSLREVISLNAGTVFDQLDKTEARDTILEMAEYWPGDLSPFWGFEIPLSENGPGMDLLFCINRPEKLAMVSQWHCTRRLPQVTTDKLESFADLWTRSDDIVNAWFEFDYRMMTRAHIFPNFFFGPAEGSHPFSVIAIAEQVFRTIGATGQRTDTFRLLADTFHRLKGKAWISQIGQMIAREDDHLRLYIQGFKADQITPLLNHLGYRYDTRPYEYILSPLKGLVRSIGLNIDLGQSIGPQIGFEFYFHSVNDALGVLQNWVTHGLCSQENYGPVATLLRQLQFAPDLPQQSFLSHLKVNVSPVGMSKSKLYIGWVENSIARSVIRTRPYTSKIEQS